MRTSLGGAVDQIGDEYGRRTRPGEEPLLRAAVAKAEHAMIAHIRRSIPHATVFSFGAIDLFPGSLAFWVHVRTDAERDALLDDPGFNDQMRKILLESGYPGDSVGRAGFTAQSDETVDRDHDGNWWYAVK